MYIKDRYGNKLRKKQQAPAPPYWRATSLLKRLLLRFQEKEVGTPLFHIVIPDFGIVFRFNFTQPMEEYKDWHIVNVDLAELEVNDIKFGEDMMWLLISKGYMAYLRDTERGQSRVFHKLIGRDGWGLKIIEKRLSLYAEDGAAKNRFMIQHNMRMRDMSISYILTYYPDFFDYLC